MFLAPIVAALLGSVATLIARVPGLRPSDDSRTVLMRVLVGALNLGGLLAFSWTQNIVLDKSMLVALLITTFGQGLVSHFTYVGIKNGAATTAPSSASNADPAAAAVAQLAAQAEAAVANAAAGN